MHRSRSGQPRHFAPKVALPRELIRVVIPFGHVIVAAVVLTVKSSMLNPSGIAGCDGTGLIVAVWPSLARWLRNLPDPYAESARTSTRRVRLPR